MTQQSLVAAHDAVNEVNLKGAASHSMDAVGWVNAKGLFDKNNYVFYEKRVSGKSAQITQQKMLHKGDIVRYDGHVSIVYSNDVSSNGTYQIIHAFGAHKTDHDNNPDTEKMFSRKVIVTSSVIPDGGKTINNPLGYGRIRLWN